jgi:hypothetical protein
MEGRVKKSLSTYFTESKGVSGLSSDVLYDVQKWNITDLDADSLSKLEELVNE